MTPEGVAEAIKRFEASWLVFSGNKHVLLKKQDGKYIVKEAAYAGADKEKPVLRVTGRFFEMGEGRKEIKDSPVLNGMVDYFENQDIETELRIAKVLGAWGCWPEKFLYVRDGAGGGFKMAV